MYDYGQWMLPGLTGGLVGKVEQWLVSACSSELLLPLSDVAQMKGTELLQNRPFCWLSEDWLSMLLMLPPPSWEESP